ncbi:MAG: DUF6351 family protein, partial [Gemmatimonadota bacterium]
VIAMVATFLVLRRLPVEAAADGGAATELEWAPAIEHVQSGTSRIRIETLSSRNDMVSGGDVLVRIELDPALDPASVAIESNGGDITAAFDEADEANALLGLVTGLALGENELTVRAGGERATLTLTNHPRSGPVFAGPSEQPFYCTTHLFQTVGGETLGPQLTDPCSVEPRVDYVYRTDAGTIEPLPDLAAKPADLTYTTTMDGRRVPFIVRVETGTANRAIYELAMLHDPAGPAPDPWNRSAGWNGRLIYRFGGGCRPGWYQQGGGTAGVVHDVELSRGYAIASSTLSVFANNCSELLSAETAMMVKERFVEAYGPPLFTIGWGASGGAHQSNGIADNYPGILDGVVVGMNFPDMTGTTSYKAVDSVLLQEYFDSVAPGTFTEEQQRAVTGFGVRASIPHLAVYALRADPDAYFADVVPESVRYDAVTNPTGARATIYDHTVNVYGRDPQTGFARRPLDNVGVQYGLGALNDGVIDVEQFLDLNERIGGVDIDFEHQPERHVADLEATRAAYRTGRIVGGLGLASTPIIDYRSYLDLQENGDNHMKYHSFSLRERLIRTNGHADNHVILTRDSRFRGGFGGGYTPDQGNETLFEALAQMDEWLTAISLDTSSRPLPEKVVRLKPADLVDACWSLEGEKIVEPQTYDGPGRCNELYPSFAVPSMVAGGPLTDDVIKCQLRPVDPFDYALELSADQLARLARIFPGGVCDWTKPGVAREPQAGPWLRARDSSVPVTDLAYWFSSLPAVID